MNRYNSIIIGAGHNGLTCAAYLARTGHKVLVLEASDAVGGLAATRQFQPGFRVQVADTVRHFSAKIVNDLDLRSHGYSPADQMQSTIGLGPDGRHIVVDDTGVEGVAKEDEAAYERYRARMQRFADALLPFWLKTMPRLGAGGASNIKTFAHIGLNIRRLGRDDMREFLRVVSLPTRDLMDENFDNDILKSVLSWDGLVGSRAAPRSPNSAVLALLYRMSGDPGNITTLINALHSAATTSGAEVRTNSPVSRITVGPADDGLAATGVQLGNGEHIDADQVISSADPKTTFLKLVGAENLEIGFSNRIRRMRSAGLVAKLHLALNALPEFTGLERADGRMIAAPTMDAIEFAYDDSKYGRDSASPVFELNIPSLNDSSLAPEGQHVLSMQAMYVPYERKGGWTDGARELLAERLISGIEQYAPRIRDQIIHHELLTPQDIEQDWHVTGGHWHHAEFAIDQLLMMRPTYEAAQYRSPIPGLWLCGAGSHPGGDLTGAPGHNAAREILR